MNITIATDTWRPQISGVVRTLETVTYELEKLGHAVRIIHTGMFPSVAVPFYPEQRLAYRTSQDHIEELLNGTDRVHILTEGPVGMAVKRQCLKRNWKFTTSYLTKFSLLLKKTVWIPEWVTHIPLRHFHSQSETIMVATPTMQEYLKENGYKTPSVIWSKGVDTGLFRPMPRVRKETNAIYVGRVSSEKDIRKFLELDIEAKKIVVGDGPERKLLQQKYPDVEFTGYLQSDDLAQAYSDADVFVFPSQFDTFGLVIIEAMACGTPVAGFPVCGPKDIVKNEEVGCLNWNLKEAVERAMETSSPEACRNLALTYSWTESAKNFLNNTVPIKGNNEQRKKES